MPVRCKRRLKQVEQELADSTFQTEDEPLAISDAHPSVESRSTRIPYCLPPGAPVFNYLPQLINGQKQGFGMVYGMIQQQAAMLAFNDIYRILAFVTLLMVPSFLLLRGMRTPAGGGAAAH